MQSNAHRSSIGSREIIEDCRVAKAHHKDKKKLRWNYDKNSIQNTMNSLKN